VGDLGLGLWSELCTRFVSVSVTKESQRIMVRIRVMKRVRELLCRGNLFGVGIVFTHVRLYFHHLLIF
jgi:hypothetical protein